MLSIRRLGRRSFEVFRFDSPIGIVRFVRSSKKWTFRYYPTPGAENSISERTDFALRKLLCPDGEYCMVDRSLPA